MVHKLAEIEEIKYEISKFCMKVFAILCHLEFESLLNFFELLS